MLNLSKQGNAIYILYGAKNYATGETVVAEIYDEANNKEGSDITLSEIGTTGLYGNTFTPNATGEWKVKIKQGSTYRSHASIKMTDYDIVSVGGDVTSIKTILEHGTYGNAAIKTAIDAIPTTDYSSDLTSIETKIDTIDTVVDSNASALTTIDTVVDGNATSLTEIKGSGFATGSDSLKAIKDYLVNTIQSSISAVQNNTRTAVSIATQMLRPTSSSTPFKIYVNVYDTSGNMEDPDVYGGYQECGLTGKTGSTATGLSDSTQYYFKVNDDGNGVTEYDITTDGTAGVDFDELIGLLNTETTGIATWSIVGGDLRCTSDTTGASSSIALSAGTTGTDLFATLTDFSSFDTAVAGSDTAMVYMSVVDESGNDRNSNLTDLDSSLLEGKKWMTRESEGRFSCTYSVSSAHDLEQLNFNFGYEEDGSSRSVDRSSIVTDHVDLESDVDTILSEVQSATYGLSALKTLIDANQTDLTNIEAKIDTIDGIVDTINTNTDTVESTLSTIDGKIDTIDGIVDTINTNTDTIESTLADGTYGLSALKTLIDSLQTAVDANQTDLTNIEAKIDTVDTVVDSNNTILSHATYGNAAIKTAIDTIDVGTGGYIG